MISIKRDVAIIWHNHLRFPCEYLADVVYRPAYSEISKKRLDFNLEGLARLVEHDVWSDPASHSIWNEEYTENEYQLWASLPSESLSSSKLVLQDISIPCSNDECGLPVNLLAPQLARIRTDDESIHCEACISVFKKPDIFFANLRRDWRVVQTRSNKDAWVAIKGAVIDGEGQPNLHEKFGSWLRDWAAQCLQDATIEGTLSNVDDAVERLKRHWGPHDLELLSALEKTIPHTYKSHIWPNISIHLAGVLVKQQRLADRELVSAKWTTDTGALSSALQRYLQYIFVRGKGWELFLYPDIRFVRDAHRLLPSSYHRWCEDYVGQRLTAGPGSFTDRTHQTDDIRQRTSILWEANFGEPYRVLCPDSSDGSNPPSSFSGAEKASFINNQSACGSVSHTLHEAESASDPFERLKALYDKPLQSSKFRLLRLEHKCAERILHYELTQHDLDAVPDYIATSYVWAPPYLRESDGEVNDALDGVRIISCNNIPITATRNAHALLERLSIVEPQRYIWMDCVR